MLHSDPWESAKCLAPSPYRLWEHHCSFNVCSVAWWLGDGCLLLHLSLWLLCQNVSWKKQIWGQLWSVGRLVCELPYLNQYTIGLQLLGKSFLAFQRCLGAICSLQSSATLQKQPKRMPACLYPTLTRVLSSYRLYRPIHQPKCTLPKGVKL